MTTSPESARAPAQPPRLLDRLRTALLIRSYAPEVTEAYLGWVRAFIHFHQLRHPETMGEAELGVFLTHLASERCLSVAQQAQARQALVFLYREFLHRELGPLPVRYTRSAGSAGPAPKPLLDQVRDVLRVRHYADTTEEAYVNWIRRFILFHDKRHPLEMREEEIEGFLTYLDGRTSATFDARPLPTYVNLCQLGKKDRTPLTCECEQAHTRARWPRVRLRLLSSPSGDPP